MSIILVTGATGAVGPCVVRALCEADHVVRTFALDRAPTGMLPSGVEELIGDIGDAPAVRQAMQDVEVVIHLAALLHIVNPPLEMLARYERINVGGTRSVVDAALAAGVGRMVLASTIAVYGSSGGRVLDETADPHPDSFYARTKLAAEKIVLDARLPDGRPLGTALRFGAIYGGRIKGNYERLVRALAHNRFIPIGSGANRRTLLYVKDAAAAVVLAACHPAAAGKVFNVSDGHFHSLCEIIAAICGALGRRPPRFSVPLGAARAAAAFIEDALRLIGRRSPVGRATIEKYTEDIAVTSERIRMELGFVPQYDLVAGWRDALAEMPVEL